LYGISFNEKENKIELIEFEKIKGEIKKVLQIG